MVPGPGHALVYLFDEKAASFVTGVGLAFYSYVGASVSVNTSAFYQCIIDCELQKWLKAYFYQEKGDIV